MSPNKKPIDPILPPYVSGDKGLIPNLVWLVGYKTKQFVICLFSLTLVAVIIVLLITIRVNYKDDNIEVNKKPTSIEQLKNGQKK